MSFEVLCACVCGVCWGGMTNISKNVALPTVEPGLMVCMYCVTQVPYHQCDINMLLNFSLSKSVTFITFIYQLANSCFMLISCGTVHTCQEFSSKLQTFQYSRVIFMAWGKENKFYNSKEGID